MSFQSLSSSSRPRQETARHRHSFPQCSRPLRRTDSFLPLGMMYPLASNHRDSEGLTPVPRGGNRAFVRIAVLLEMCIHMTSIGAAEIADLEVGGQPQIRCAAVRSDDQIGENFEPVLRDVVCARR